MTHHRLCVSLDSKVGGCGTMFSNLSVSANANWHAATLSGLFRQSLTHHLVRLNVGLTTEQTCACELLSCASVLKPLLQHLHVSAQDSHPPPHANAASPGFSRFAADINPSFAIVSDAFVSSLAKLLARLKNVRLAPRRGSRAHCVADKPTSKRLHTPEQTASSTYAERLSAGPFHSEPSASRSSKFPSPAVRLIPKIDFVSVLLRLLVSKEIVVPPPLR